jgi:hypothetical protein
MDNAIAAMNSVLEHLAAGDVIGAQGIVMVVESIKATLPSSMFEKVLKAAIAADCLTTEYRTWCERAYGRKVFAAMVGA